MQGAVGQVYPCGTPGLASSDCTLESGRRNERENQSRVAVVSPKAEQRQRVPVAAQEDQVPRSRKANGLVARVGRDAMQAVRTK